MASRTEHRNMPFVGRVELDAIEKLNKLDDDIGKLVTQHFKNLHSGNLNEQCISSDDEQAEKAFKLIKLMFKYAETHKLDHLSEIIEKDAEDLLLDFKSSVKDKKYSEAQYSIVQRLNDIESRVKDYPLLTPKEALPLFGHIGSANPSRDIEKAQKQHLIMTFNFGESKKTQIPAFQFDTQRLKVWSCIPKLSKLLSGLNDWSLYHWFTTYDLDLNCTPADAVSDPKKEADLMDIAGLYKNEFELSCLNYVSKAGDSNE